MHKRPAATVAERGSFASPTRYHQTAGGLAAKDILIPLTAKPSFAARRQTELKRLRLNAVPLGDSPELPRLSSRGFRCENTLGGGLPPTRPVACFTRSGLFWRSGTPRSASLHVGLNACHRLRRFGPAKSQTNPDRLCLNAERSDVSASFAASLCELCVFTYTKKHRPNTQIT